MTLQWIPLISLLVVNFFLDIWLYRKFRRSEHWPRLKSGVHAVLSLVLLAVIMVAVFTPHRQCDNHTFVGLMWMLYIYYAFYVPRYLAAMVWVPTHLKRCGPRVRKCGAVVATVVGVAAFLFMWSGDFFTTYRINVNRVELEFENLPPEFDGYRIAQFSDTHLGTYDGNPRFMTFCVDSIMAQKPDLICFTGDLVSRFSSEALPHKQALSCLHAPDGVLSVLGNHDDGHYFQWPSEEQRQADQQALIDLEREMGWKVLVNDHIILRRDSSEIAVIGTECFDSWPFPKKGFLDSAYVDYETSKRFTILLQHNPTQWDLDNIYKLKLIDFRLCDKVDLMLSGHTHAMQCMITLFGHKFSPASLNCEFWGGEYSKGNHKLYVNIGLGMVGMPVRLGSAYPEVTLITLKKKKTK